MSLYQVTVYDQGEYQDRQNQARGFCDLYLEQHFNGFDDPRADYAMAVVAENARPESVELAREYALRAAEVCPARAVRSAGPVQVGGRGAVSTRYLDVPGCLMEPGFVSNPTFAAWARTPEGLDALAGLIVHVVRGALPQGGRVGLSIGHVNRDSHPGDRGAPWHGGGWEADLAGSVVQRAAEILRSVTPHPRPS